VFKVFWKKWCSAWVKENVKNLLGTDTSVEFLTGIKVAMEMES